MAINSLGTTMRFTGMYSGIDTDSLVKNMMKIEQLKLDKQTRALTNMQWKQESYNTTNTELKAFMNDYISMLGANSMMKSSNYVSYKASTTGKNADAVTVEATADAYYGTFSIDKISQLATSSKAESLSKVSKDGTELAASNSTALKDLNFAKDMQFVDGKISFAINNHEFTFSMNDSLQTVMNTVNSSGAGVNMTYSRLTDKISVESTATGSDQSVSIRNISGNAFGGGGAFGIDNGDYRNGKDAKLTINGVDVVKSSNTFTLDGLKYTLHNTTVKEGEEPDPIGIRLDKDVTGAVDSIKKFVDGFNVLIRKLNELVYTRKASDERGYTPLTEEEKESMTDEQIEKWETIAKKGLLYNDAGLKGLLTQLRGALYDSIQGMGMSPSDIGLRTGDYTKYGEIELDEDRLKAALELNSQDVMSVFTKISESEDESTKYKENGLLYRINGLMNNYIKGSGQNSLDNLDRSIFSIDKKISQMEDRMAELEEKYYLKYAALEEAMAGMSSQSDWLSTMLGSIGS